MLLSNSDTMALGELIGEDRGKMTGERVLDVQVPKMETSFTMEGNYRGTLCTDVGTYTSVLREGGVLYGEGQGIVTTKDGQGIATWTGQGIGRFIGPGTSVSVVHFSSEHLRCLRGENCRISIT